MQITHHFGPKNDMQGVSVGTYIKLTTFRAGERIPMHEHVHSHQSLLCKGWADVIVDGVSRTIRGPAVVDIVAGKRHEVHALSDIAWACIHATDETDEQQIDERLVG